MGEERRGKRGEKFNINKKGALAPVLFI